MGLISHLIGGVTETSAIAKAMTSGTAVSLALRRAVPDPFDPAAELVFAAGAPDDGLVTLNLTGLSPNTRYIGRYVVDGTPDLTRPISFRTQPVTGKAASYRIVATSCAGHAQAGSGTADIGAYNVSNNPAFATMIERDPLAILWNGDWGYPDILTNEPAKFRAFYEANLAQPNQQACWDHAAMIYVIDDHDSVGNDGNGTSASVPAFKSEFRRRIPTYDLPADPALPLYSSRMIGRVLWVLTEERTARSPNAQADGPTKTMLGDAQKAWFKDTLATTAAKAIVWVTGSNCLNGGVEGYLTSFTTEFLELIPYIRAYQARGGIFVAQEGNVHWTFLDDGRSHLGGFPIACLGPLDSYANAVPTYPYSHGWTGGWGSYGTIDIDDDGDSLSIHITPYINNRPWRTMRLGRPGRMG